MTRVDMNTSGIGLLVIDIQERLFEKIYEKDKLCKNCLILIKSFQIMGLPIVVTRQYPKGLGDTITPIREAVARYPHEAFDKCSFSCIGPHVEPEKKSIICKKPVSTWVLAGIETHICVQQTAFDLTKEKKEVIIPACAVSSRFPENTRYAIEEMRKTCRITTVEAYLFELLQTSQSPYFKAISELVK